MLNVEGQGQRSFTVAATPPWADRVLDDVVSAAGATRPKFVWCEDLDGHFGASTGGLVAIGERDQGVLAEALVSRTGCGLEQARVAALEFTLAHEIAHEEFHERGIEHREEDADVRALETCRRLGRSRGLHEEAVKYIVEDRAIKQRSDVAGWLGVIPAGCSLPAVPGLEANTTPEFRAKLYQIAGRIPGMNPDWLAKIISWETGGTFSPTIRPRGSDGRPLSSAVGLLQFLKNIAESLGTSTEALERMTAVQQLDYVEKYYAKYAPNGVRSLCDAYYVVFAPNCRGRSADFVVYPAGSAAYNANRAADRSGDGSISCGEVCNLVSNIPSRRIDVPCAVAVSSTGGGRSILLPVALGVLALVAGYTFPRWRGSVGV